MGYPYGSIHPRKVGRYYLNIKKPAPESVAYRALNRFKGQNEAGIKAREYLERLGYDGVNNSDEEYIAFNSNQIKRIDNKAPTENEDVRFSVRDNTPNEMNPDGKTLAEQIKEAHDTAIPNERRYIYVGKFTSEFVNALSEHIKIQDLPIGMNYRDAYLAMESRESGKYQGEGINYHGLGENGLADALESIDQTSEIMASKKSGRKIELALQTIDKKGNRCLAIVEVNTIAQPGGNFLPAHVVTSVYGKRNIEQYIANAKDEGRLWDIKIEPSAQGMPKVQYDGDINANGSTRKSISQPEDFVNTKEFSDKKNILYVTVTLESIKKNEVIKQTDVNKDVAGYSHSFNISVADFLRFVKPTDENLFKYFPKQLQDEILEKENTKPSLRNPTDAELIFNATGENVGEREQIASFKKTSTFKSLFYVKNKTRLI